MTRRENDFYPTPDSIIKAMLNHWHPGVLDQYGIWETCAGDHYLADCMKEVYDCNIITGDIITGEDFFTISSEGDFGDVAAWRIQSSTGNQTNGTLLELSSTDVNVDKLIVGERILAKREVLSGGELTMPHQGE